MRRGAVRARALALAAGVAAAAGPGVAGEADVLAVSARCDAARRCDFEATLRHADEGWSHYADLWIVEDAAGRVLGRRVLRHPHVREQPFTRALAGVEIPDGTSEVRVRARDSHHGFGGRAVALRLPTGAGAVRSEEEAPAVAAPPRPAEAATPDRAGAPPR